MGKSSSSKGKQRNNRLNKASASKAIAEAGKKGPEDASLGSGTAPKSFVIRSSGLSRFASQLALDIRKVMEPNTATRLKERRRNRLKDYVSIAGPMGVSHLMLFKQTSHATSLRLSRFPQGPTLFFQILEYTLAKEILLSQKRPHSPGSCKEFEHPSLLVLNCMPIHTDEGKLMCSMLQGLFPSINTAKVKLDTVKRLSLFHWNKDEEVIEFRHYFVKVKKLSSSQENRLLLRQDPLSEDIKPKSSKLLKKIMKSQIPDLSKFTDAAECLLKNEGMITSDSEIEADTVVMTKEEEIKEKKKFKGKESSLPLGPSKSEQRSITLTEIGPRMKLRLEKITDAIGDGKILFERSC